MRKILLELSYLGGAYAGFQVQKNAPTVQQTVQDALEALLSQRPPLTGCSRTDAGVHARRYYAAFPTESPIPVQRIPAALNFHLPKDISVLGACEVDEAFHPRYDALAKTYRYRIWLPASRNVFEAQTSFHHPRPVDLQAFVRLAPLFEGTHDFCGFAGSGGSVKSTVRTVYRCRAFEQEGMLTMEITGNGFLYNMVRIMAGALLDCGTGKLSLAAVEEALRTGNRELLGKTLPAKGLTLLRVEYPFPLFSTSA